MLSKERPTRSVRRCCCGKCSPCRVIDAADVVPFPNTVRERSCCVGMALPVVVGQWKRTEERVFPPSFTPDGSLMITDFSAHELNRFESLLPSECPAQMHRGSNLLPMISMKSIQQHVQLHSNDVHDEPGPDQTVRKFARLAVWARFAGASTFWFLVCRSCF